MSALPFDSDTWLSAALTPWSLYAWVVLWMFGLTLWMIGEIAVIQILRQLAARRVTTLEGTWEPLLFAAANGEAPAALPPLARRDRLPLLKLWCRISDYLTDDSQGGLNDIARRAGLERYVRRILKPGAVVLREPTQVEIILAIQAVRKLRIDAAWAEVAKLVRRGPPPLDRYAAQTLVALDARRAAADVVPVLDRQGRWARHLVEDLIDVGVTAAVTAYADLLGKVPESTVPGLALLLERCGRHEVAPAVRARLNRPDIRDPEAIAALLHALSIVGDPSDLALIRTFVAHAQGFVRMRAAQALGRCGAATEADALETLLCDSNWHTRYHAARAIVAVPALGADHLAKLRDTCTDRFARDIATHVLAELEAPAVRGAA